MRLEISSIQYRFTTETRRPVPKLRNRSADIDQMRSALYPIRMPIPSHTERPDLYDGYDFQEPRNPASAAYWQRVMPEHVKRTITERQAAVKVDELPTRAE
jgi:hypothetical protein